MTRFWITLEQGVLFVLSCLESMKGGEIFVPKIPSMKITDLATLIAPGCEQVVTGIRQGEKLHECLVTSDEPAVDWGDRYVIQYGSTDSLGGFTYSSDGNSDWLDERKARELL
jgi:UDP-N-acetylglucosamine 4,6-dehydratase